MIIQGLRNLINAEDLRGLHFMTWLSASGPEKHTGAGRDQLRVVSKLGWPVTLASTRWAEAGGALPSREQSGGH